MLPKDTIDQPDEHPRAVFQRSGHVCFMLQRDRVAQITWGPRIFASVNGLVSLGLVDARRICRMTRQAP